jgi:flagellar biosynthetic protein FlhB
MSEYEEKTEQATPRKYQKAREKGQVPRSRELLSMVTTGGIILMFYFSGNSFLNDLSASVRKFLGMEYGINPAFAIRFAAAEMFHILLPFLGISFTFALLAGVAQGGFVLKPLGFEIEKLNPVGGLKKLFSKNSLIEFLKSLFKFVTGGFILYSVIKNLIRVLPATAAMDIGVTLSIFCGLLSKAVIITFVIFFFFAIADYIYQRWDFARSLRMTKEEVRQEFKETEGDPLIKSRIKSVQKEMARRRMMQDVPRATVVITNPTHIAVALKYRKDEMSAPMVVAKGAGFVAEKIKETARKHRVPVVEDKPLARTLYKLQINAFIPAELYRAVAKILAYIYNLRGAA